MAEAIISRRGYGIDGKPQLRTETITGNTNWIVPLTRGNNSISVRLFGGGAAGTQSYGGGGGWMNNGEFTNLTPNQIIQITIGDGGNNIGTQSGGTTSFGTYLSANGGSGINGGSGGGGWEGGKGYQFGGGGGNANGGDGGIWGGGGGGFYKNGGNGGTYGGGGGCGMPVIEIAFHGGNGGIYGGGGTGGRLSRASGPDHGTGRTDGYPPPDLGGPPQHHRHHE